MYDIIIIGAGPAGLAAGIYAARKKLQTLVLTEAVPTEEALHEPGIGFLAASFKHELGSTDKHLELKKQISVVRLEKNIVSFLVEDKTGKVYYARAVIIATGQDDAGQGNTSFDEFTEKLPSGHVKVDAGMQTNVPGVYAAGHVNYSTGKDAFVAAAQGAQAALNAAEYLKSLT